MLENSNLNPGLFKEINNKLVNNDIYRTKDKLVTSGNLYQ